MPFAVYIAAPWADKADIPAIAKQLTARGHKITHKWWDYPDIPEDGKADSYLKDCALNDLAGVYDAEVLLLINSKKSEGKAVEQGVAICQGIPIIAVGVRGAASKNVFHYIDNYIWVKDLADALEVLDDRKGELFA